MLVRVVVHLLPVWSLTGSWRWIIYSINTGLITTLCVIASLVSSTPTPCSPPSTLIARKRIRASGEGVNTTSDNQGTGFSLKDLSTQSKAGTLGTKTSIGRVGLGSAFSAGGGRLLTELSLECVRRIEVIDEERLKETERQ
ncbi:hypothetical protein BDZ89DRAFT_1046717 [Hymenopellis radicata]|nr:hypothetical protein BDZ89DRAFT_1046717 [Hymenopellis radicata]